MPPLEQQFRTQPAVLWAIAVDANGTPLLDSYGKPKVQEPIELLVRWTDTQQSSLGAQENVEISSAQVVVDRPIALNSIMRKGTMQSLSNPPGNLHRVAQYNETMDIKGRAAARTVTLVHFAESLPTVVS